MQKNQNIKFRFEYLILEGPEPLHYVCLSVMSVMPAVSGVCGADEHPLFIPSLKPNMSNNTHTQSVQALFSTEKKLKIDSNEMKANEITPTS